MKKTYKYRKYEHIIFKDFKDETTTIFDDYMKFFSKRDLQDLGVGIFTITGIKIDFALETSTTVGVDSKVTYLNLLNFEESIIEREFECLLSKFDEKEYVKLLNEESNSHAESLTDLEDVVDEHYSEDILKSSGEYVEKYHDLLSQNIRTKTGQLITGDALDKLKKSNMRFTQEDIKTLTNISLRTLKTQPIQKISNVRFYKRIDGKALITDDERIPNSTRVGHYLIKYMNRDIKKIELYDILYKICNHKK